MQCRPNPAVHSAVLNRSTHTTTSLVMAANFTPWTTHPDHGLRRKPLGFSSAAELVQILHPRHVRLIHGATPPSPPPSSISRRGYPKYGRRFASFTSEAASTTLWWFAAQADKDRGGFSTSACWGEGGRCGTHSRCILLSGVGTR